MNNTKIHMSKPELLGKFYSVNNVKRLHRVLVQNRLYFADSANFNDPFEMNPALFKIRKFKPVTNTKYKIPIDVIRNTVKELWITQKILLQKCGVCCFSEESDDILMWSHYADNHKGICIIFNTKYKFFSGLRKIDYISKREQVTFLKNREKPIDIMTSKAQLWCYEKEWRLFRKLKSREYKYPKSSLAGIIFGCRCSPEDRDIIYRLAGKNKLKYFEAIMSPYEYKLDIVEIRS